MTIRTLFFWFHLVIGCSAAIFIFLMSFTGVALTYERQVIQSAQKTDFPVASSENFRRLALDKIVYIAKSYPVEKAATISFSKQHNAPFVIKEGRKTLAYLNPFTGEEIAEPGRGTREFMGKLRAFHRWLTLDGKFSEAGRWVNGIANIIFFLLALTGLYLWLPAKFKQRAFKQKLTLTKTHPNKQARNYQWHNTFGFYMAPILIVVIFTAFFFSFKWPGKTLESLVSTDTKSFPAGVVLTSQISLKPLSTEELFVKVNKANPNWNTLSFLVANKALSLQVFDVDMGSGGEPQKKKSVYVDTLSGEFVAEKTFDDYSTYRKIRNYIRFLHTGEVYGLIGQTIAGIASLLACLLVYTGLMMSLRRWKNSRAKATA